MNESRRTLTYVAAAAVSVLLAFVFAPANPTPPSDFGDVGKSFFPEFDVATAKLLKVVTFSDNANVPDKFIVEQKNGKWGILIDPARETYYPADGADRLGRTAASVINIKREQFVTKDPEQYPTFQVVDPLDEDMTKLLGRGRRITIKNAEEGDDGVLADYIIGKKVPRRESDGDQAFYYVRRPDEKAVYTARLNIDLSTKFSDWIEADLLKLQGENIIDMLSHKYTLLVDQETGGAQLKGEENNILTRDKPSDPWKLQGLNEETEEVNQDEVGIMLRGLDELKIIGARAKPEQLTADLKSPAASSPDRSGMRDLASKGFYLLQDGRYLSNEGEVEAITDAGVKYTFRFGKDFLASDSQIETGLEPEKKGSDDTDASKKDSGGKTKVRYLFITTEFVEEGLGPKPTPPVKRKILPPAEVKPEEKKADAPKAEQPKSDDKKDEKKPEPKAEEKKPETPKVEAPKADEPKKDAPKPEEKKPEEKKTEEPKADEKKPEDKPCGDSCDANAQEAEAKPAKTEEKKPEQPKEESKPAEVKKPEAATPPANDKPAAVKSESDKPAAKEPEPVVKDAKAKAPEAKSSEPKGPTPEQQAEAEYVQAQAKYKQDLKAYEDKVTAGKKKVKELNARFAQWYYVISDEDFQKLRLSRKSLVKPKTKAEPSKDGTPPGLLPGVKTPGGLLPQDLSLEPDLEGEKAKPKTPKETSTEKPATEKPAVEEKKPEPSKTETPPKAEEKKPEVKSSEEKKSEEKKPD